MITQTPITCTTTSVAGDAEYIVEKAALCEYPLLAFHNHSNSNTVSNNDSDNGNRKIVMHKKQVKISSTIPVTTERSLKQAEIKKEIHLIDSIKFDTFSSLMSLSGSLNHYVKTREKEARVILNESATVSASNILDTEKETNKLHTLHLHDPSAITTLPNTKNTDNDTKMQGSVFSAIFRYNTTPIDNNTVDTSAVIKTDNYDNANEYYHLLSQSLCSRILPLANCLLLLNNSLSIDGVSNDSSSRGNSSNDDNNDKNNCSDDGSSSVSTISFRKANNDNNDINKSSKSIINSATLSANKDKNKVHNTYFLSCKISQLCISNNSYSNRQNGLKTHWQSGFDSHVKSIEEAIGVNRRVSDRMISK